ncbi:MAG: tetratricopeptide repeat protein [Planctomycetota bacterium]
MTDETTKGKGDPFFDRADQIVETGNWDFAIEMYLQGIAKEPEAIERGLEKLRAVALMRKASGGKPAGFMEKLKHKPDKDPLTSLTNALWLISREPGDVGVWKHIVQAARKGGWKTLLEWAGGMLFEANRLSSQNKSGKDKSVKDIYVFLTDVYEEAELYSDAVRACQMAIQRDSRDENLLDRMRDLSAKETIQKGRYDKEGDFTKAVVDLKGQMDLAKKDQVSQDADYLTRQVEQTRAAYEAEPTVEGKINAFVDALIRTDDESYENEAIDVLTKAYADTDNFRFKSRIGDIKIRQLNRRFNKLKKAKDMEGAKRVAKELLALELEVYAERAANYPTDLGIKYELGRRQFVAGQYDQAITILQQARRDPKRRVPAMNLLGQAFFKKGWHTEAAETFEQALADDLTEARKMELMYNLGVVLEAQGKNAEALEQYSDVAQIDFNYKDVRERIERLRGQKGTPPDDQAAEA